MGAFAPFPFLEVIVIVETFDALWSIVILPLRSLGQIENPLIFVPAFCLILGWCWSLLYKVLSCARGG